MINYYWATSYPLEISWLEHDNNIKVVNSITTEQFI